MAKAYVKPKEMTELVSTILNGQGLAPQNEIKEERRPAAYGMWQA